MGETRNDRIRRALAPLVDVVPHPTRYMVRCSTCGIVAQMLSPMEAANERDTHSCEAVSSDG